MGQGSVVVTAVAPVATVAWVLFLALELSHDTGATKQTKMYMKGQYELMRTLLSVVSILVLFIIVVAVKQRNVYQ